MAGPLTLLGCVRGDLHVSLHRHRGLDRSAAALERGPLRAGARRSSRADPVRAGRARRPGGGHAGGRAVRGVLLTQRLPGGGHRHAAGAGGARVARRGACPGPDGHPHGRGVDDRCRPDRPGRASGRPGGRGRLRRPGAAVRGGGDPGARLASGRGHAEGSRRAPPEGSGARGAHLPAPDPGPAGRVSPAALPRQPGPAEQPPGPALHVRRTRPGAGRNPCPGGLLAHGHPDRRRRGRQDPAEPAGSCRDARRLRRRGVAGRTGRGRRSAGRAGSYLRDARDRPAARAAGPGVPDRDPGAAGHADRAGQLRAFDRRLRQDRRRPSAALPAGARARHQPRAARHQRRGHLPGAVVVAARGRRSRGPRVLRRRSSCSWTGPGPRGPD